MRGYDKHDPQNEYRVHGISITRDGGTVGWNYGSATSTGEPVRFSVPADDLDGPPKYWSAESDEWEQYMSHAGTFTDGRTLYFGGPVKKLGPAGDTNGWGLWMRLPGKPPIFMGGKKPSSSGGHCTWTGNDPDWGFAHAYARDGWEIVDWILAARGEPREVRFICRPNDRRRGGGKAGYDGIPRPNQSPDATKVWFHSSMLMPDDTSTGSYIAVFRRPHAPTELSAKGRAGAVEISWKPHALSHEVKGYHVWRGDASGRNLVEVSTGAVAGTSFTDPGAPAGSRTYAVTAEEHSRLESDTTSPVLRVTVSARSVSSSILKPDGVSGWDGTAPSAPRGLAAEREAPGQYRLRWTAPPEADLRHYNVYFSSEGEPEVAQKRLAWSPPAGTNSLLDWAAPTAGPAHYAVTAVDRQGNESQPARVSVE
jgi:hypothetical protein